jgi:hypothetical protein
MSKDIIKTFRFSQEEAELLSQQAKDHGMSESAWVRFLMREYDRQEKAISVVSKMVKKGKKEK